MKEWLEWLAKYYDLISNIMDLLSFILVTPELIKVARPTSYSIISAMAILGLLCILLVPLWYLSYRALYLINHWNYVGQFDYFWALAGLAMIVWAIQKALRESGIYDLIIEKAFGWAERMSIHTFAIGLTVFAFSRILGVWHAAFEKGILPRWLMGL